MFLLNLNYLIFYYLIVVTTIHQICHCSHSSIELHEPNQYKGIVIAFSTEIPDADAKALLDKTQDLITKASAELYSASGRRAYFNEVNFVVPHSWSSEVDIGKIQPSDVKYKYSEADIIISSNTEVQSFTFQYAGCGKHSLPIVLSRGVLSDGNNNYGNTSKLFVHEWAHYRYGVFNEFGFPEDNMYPLYYSIPGKQSDDIHITSCADSQQDFNRLVDRYMSGGECHLNTSNESGLPTNDCLPLPNVANNTFKSSYMYQQAANSVEHFCGFSDHKHNVNSPNKHNVLCNGRETWSVIMDHPDMKKSKEDNSYLGVTFKYSIDPKPNHTMIAVMNSNVMNINKRDKWLNAALKKFLKTDLSSDSMAKLFEFKGNETLFNVDEWQSASGIIYDIFYDGIDNSNNFSNVLRAADDAFTGIVSGTLIIVIGGHSITQSNTIETIAHNLRKKSIKLKIIVYPPITGTDLKNAVEIFEMVLDITGGSLIFVKEDTTVAVNTLQHLFGAFENTLVDYAGGEIQKEYTLKTQTFSAPKELISFNFSIDPTISAQFNIYFIQTYIQGPGMINVYNAIIRKPNNTTVNASSPHKDDHIVKYVVNQGITSGFWSISVSLYPVLDLHPSDSIIAMAKYQSTNLNSIKVRDAKKSITANCWINSDKGIHTIDSSNHLTIYVQINKDVDDVVQDANITAELLNESANRVGAITLTDDGLGDPDITAGDGIYSQYISIETEGIYYITANVMSKKDNVKIVSKFGSTSLPTKHDSDSKFCCGSKIPEVNAEHVDSEYLIRQIDCGSVYLFVNEPPTNYPPNSIRNLRVNNTDSLSRTVDLVWTAPGAYLTSGVVQRYEIKAFVGSEEDRALREAIIKSFDSKSGARIEYDQIVPLNYGSQQKITVKIGSDDGGVYHFAIKSFNRNNIGSSVSNIAIAYIGNVEKPSTTAFPNDVSKEKVAVPKQTAKIAGIDWWIFMVILIACVLILVFVIIFIICFICKRRRKNEEQPTYKIDAPQRRAPEPPRVSPQLSKNSSINIENGSLTHSIDKIADKNPLFINTNNNINNNTNNNAHNNYNPGSEPSLRELNVNTLSPVQSWDAKDLLSHWGRVQEAKQKRETPPVMRIEDIEVNSTPSHRSLSYASSDDDNSATYSRPGTWRYQNLNAKPTYIGSGYPEPTLRNSVDPMRSNTPSDSVPRYSTVNRRPTTTVSQV